MKASKRIAHEILILAALSLGSCNDQHRSGYTEFTDKQYDQISDISREATANDRERLDAIEEKLHMDSGN